MTLSNTIERLTEMVSIDWDATQTILNHDHQHKLQLIQAICNQRSKGKQLRSLLVLSIGHLFHACNETHHQLAAIVEVIHYATLLHDDVIDQAVKRHNKPTAWTTHGNKASILVGDYMFSRAFRWISELKDPIIIQSLAQATQLIVEGEVEQHQVKGLLSLDEETYFTIIHAKTAELFRQTCMLGAYAAHASPTLQQHAEAFGLNIGIAFQLQDDLLDYVSADSGKSTGQDWSEGKVTYPLIVAYRKDPQTMKRFFKNKESFDDVLHFLKTVNAFKDTQEKINHYTDLALDALNQLPDHDIKQPLLELTEWMRHREY